MQRRTFDDEDARRRRLLSRHRSRQRRTIAVGFALAAILGGALWAMVAGTRDADRPLPPIAATPAAPVRPSPADPLIGAVADSLKPRPAAEVTSPGLVVLPGEAIRLDAGPLPIVDLTIPDSVATAAAVTGSGSLPVPASVWLLAPGAAMAIAFASTGAPRSRLRARAPRRGCQDS